MPAALTCAGCLLSRALRASWRLRGAQPAFPLRPQRGAVPGRPPSTSSSPPQGPARRTACDSGPGTTAPPRWAGAAVAQARGGSALSRGALLRGRGGARAGQRWARARGSEATRLDAGSGGSSGGARAAAPGRVRPLLAKRGGPDLACGWIRSRCVLRVTERFLQRGEARGRRSQEALAR